MLRRGLLAIFVVCVLFLVAPPGWAGEPAGAAVDTAARVQRMYEAYRDRDFPGVPELDVERARTLAESTRVIWLDVRSARERRVSMLRGAIDRDTFERLGDDGPRLPVVVYCTVGYRSGRATGELRARGIEAYNLAGGVLAWIHAGGALVDGRTGEDTHRVHVYGRRWNLVPKDWRAVW